MTADTAETVASAWFGTAFAQLQLDIIEGGWRWRCIGAQRGRWRVPRWLLPRSEAFKRIEGDCYRFSVSFSLPLLGEMLRYGRLPHERAGD